MTLVDTGQDTMTGGRIRRARDQLDHDRFCLTFGDGVADIDIPAAMAFHHAQGTGTTVTAV